MAETTIVTNQVNLKCTGAEITTGTDDTKFATPKALKDAGFSTLAKGYVTVGVGQNYTDLGDAMDAGHRYVEIVGSVSESDTLDQGMNIYIRQSATLTLSSTSNVYGVRIRGPGTLVLSDWVFNNSTLSNLDITINVVHVDNLLYFTDSNTTTGCDFTIEDAKYIQISGTSFKSAVTGNKFDLNLIGESEYGTSLNIQNMSNNNFYISGATGDIVLSGVSNSRIYIDTSNDTVRLEYSFAGNVVEWDDVSAYVIDVSEGYNPRITGNYFSGSGAYSGQTCSILGGGSSDRMTFTGNIVTATVTKTNIDKGTYCNNLVYANAADSGCTNVTSANNQTGY